MTFPGKGEDKTYDCMKLFSVEIIKQLAANEDLQNKIALLKSFSPTINPEKRNSCHQPKVRKSREQEYHSVAYKP
jgi:hypothetical protein